MLAHALAAALLSALCALCASAALHCALRREISPCTCRREDNGNGGIVVHCQRIGTYHEIAKALTNKFTQETKVGLDISHSQLQDFGQHTFRDLGLSITRLKLNNDNLSELKENVFTKLDLVDFFSLADNQLSEMPRHVLRHLPHVKTLDLCRNKLSKLSEEDFKDIQEVEHLVVAGNQISKIERHAVPKALKHIHLGINKLTSLNGALRELDDLEWIFINANNLKSIDNELPVRTKKLTLIHAARNELQNLPKELKLLPSLDSLYFYDNNIKSLDGSLQKSMRLVRLSLSFNKIDYLAEDEFAEAENLADLDIAYNQLKSFNGSLRYLKSLRYLNVTHNFLTEFSLQEFKGLNRLSVLDMSYNKISSITGHMENLVDFESGLLELRLDNNHIINLGGALIGMRGLLRLNLSNNQIEKISAEDLMGMEVLKILDVSHNNITSLEETSKTFLPSLEELIAHHNNITVLDKEFHGLPSLCFADFSYNKIRTVNYELVSKSQCIVNGVPSLLKIHLQENPVMCDDRYFELVSLLESLNALASGTTVCVAPQTVAPVLMQALNDVAPEPPIRVVSRMGGSVLVLPEGRKGESQPKYRRVGALIGHVLGDPPAPPPPRDARPHPLADHLRLRDLNASPQ